MEIAAPVCPDPQGAENCWRAAGGQDRERIRSASRRRSGKPFPPETSRKKMARRFEILNLLFGFFAGSPIIAVPIDRAADGFGEIPGGLPMQERSRFVDREPQDRALGHGVLRRFRMPFTRPMLQHLLD